ncbi:cation:proton antiporter [Microvirga sp. W0021]|uniref:Cation:proton antiporter n=1 Tax=Hohaiivirga grylli TaxID=3133970 RepID=A0ABV0BLH2_9HYPH
MSEPVPITDLKELVLFLGTAGVIVPIFSKLKISPVLGFLGAGALLGPFGLGQLSSDIPWLHWVTFPNKEDISHFAELGVVFLLFTIGIELSWQRLRALKRYVFGVGSLQVLLSTIALGAVCYYATGLLLASAIIGLTLSLSSTAIALPVLAEQKRLQSPAGRISFAILLFQDLAAAPILFAVGLFSSGQPDNLLWSFLWAFGQAALAVFVIFIAGRLILRPIFKLAANTLSTEFFMAACLLVVLLSSILAAASGLSMALGAFIAGLLLAETEYRRAILATIEPFKGLLLGLFFITIGMDINVGSLLNKPLTILAATISLIVIKTMIVYAIARAFHLAHSVAIETALVIGPAGEFAFVIIGSAVSAQLLPNSLAQPVLLLVTLSMIVLPVLARIGTKIGKRLVQQKAQADETIAISNAPVNAKSHVIVIGYGRVGQLVSEMLERHDVPYIVIDANPSRVSSARKAGYPVYFGDSSAPNLLHACGIENAKALVLSIDNPKLAEQVVSTARRQKPDLTIVARAVDARHATLLYEMGVDNAVPESIEASLQLSEAVLVDIGIAMGKVLTSIHERRDEFRSILNPKKDQSRAERTEFKARRSSHKN